MSPYRGRHWRAILAVDAPIWDVVAPSFGIAAAILVAATAPQ